MRDPKWEISAHLTLRQGNTGGDSMKQFATFFSYSRDDSDFVLKLASELRAQGVDLWLDQLDIVGGERWDKAIEEALESCQTLIVVLSPSSVESVNVMDEVSYALESGKRVVPVLCRACDVPFRLRRVQRIDFVNDYEGGFKSLVRSLRHASGDAAAPLASAARVEPPAEQASGGSGGRLGKQLAIGLTAAAVLALVSFLAFQSTQKGDDGSATGETGASSPDAPRPCTEVVQLQQLSRPLECIAEAGPIWNQQNADQKCPGVCEEVKGSWDGHWWTTVPGKMSVCQCVLR